MGLFFCSIILNTEGATGHSCLENHSEHVIIILGADDYSSAQNLQHERLVVYGYFL